MQYRLLKEAALRELNEDENTQQNRLNSMDPRLDRMPTKWDNEDYYSETDPEFGYFPTDKEELLDAMRIDRNKVINAVNSMCWYLQRGQNRSATASYLELVKYDGRGLFDRLMDVARELLGFDPEKDIESRKKAKDAWDPDSHDTGDPDWSYFGNP